MASADNKDRSDSKQPAVGAPPGSERHRDEARKGGGPRYGGEGWAVADERGDRRFGHARNDDSNPSELKPGEAENDDNEAVNATDPDLADAGQEREMESGAQHEGMHRGSKPGKSKDREA
jgi:hypothetical protein